MIEASDLAKGSLVMSIAVFIFAMIFNIYSLWLNYKQAKVKELMQELIDEVKMIRRRL